MYINLQLLYTLNSYDGCIVTNYPTLSGTAGVYRLLWLVRFSLDHFLVLYLMGYRNYYNFVVSLATTTASSSLRQCHKIAGCSSEISLPNLPEKPRKNMNLALLNTTMGRRIQ